MNKFKRIDPGRHSFFRMAINEVLASNKVFSAVVITYVTILTVCTMTEALFFYLASILVGSFVFSVYFASYDRFTNCLEFRRSLPVDIGLLKKVDFRAMLIITLPFYVITILLSLVCINGKPIKSIALLIYLVATFFNAREVFQYIYESKSQSASFWTDLIIALVVYFVAAFIYSAILLSAIEELTRVFRA